MSTQKESSFFDSMLELAGVGLFLFLFASLVMFVLKIFSWIWS